MSPEATQGSKKEEKSTQTAAGHHSSSKPYYIISPQGLTLFLLKELVNHSFFLKTVPSTNEGIPMATILCHWTPKKEVEWELFASA